MCNYCRINNCNPCYPQLPNCGCGNNTGKIQINNGNCISYAITYANGVKIYTPVLDIACIKAAIDALNS